MRRVVTLLAVNLLLSASAWGGGVAAPIDLNEIITDETPEERCDRLAADPFIGFGPDEWSHPFSAVDHFRALPACTKALEAHPDEQRFALGAAMAHVVGKKPEAAKPLLDDLIAKDNASAMLVMAYISPEDEAAELMRRAAEAGNPNAMMLYGMTLMTGKGVPKDEIEGVQLVRQAADNGSTRAMLLMANFYNQNVYGVGLNPREGTRLINKAAALGDPAAKNILANLEAGATGDTTPQ